MYRTFCLSVFLTSIANICLSAEIEECDIELLSPCISVSGLITYGDSDDFRLLAGKLSHINPNVSITVLLHSDGGDFEEALSLADTIRNYNTEQSISSGYDPERNYLHEPLNLINEGMATRILSNSECVSACAFIFMAGRTRMYGIASFQANRTVELGGVLAFHAPFLSVGTGSFRQGIDATRRIKTVLQEAMPDSLLISSLFMEPKQRLDFSYISDSVRWNISVDSLDISSIPAREGILNACMNFYLLKEGLLNYFPSDPSTALYPLSDRYSGNLNSKLIEYDEEAEYNIYLRSIIEVDKDTDIFYRRYWVELNMDKNNVGYEDASYGFLAANGKIAFSIPFSYMDELVSFRCSGSFDCQSMIFVVDNGKYTEAIGAMSAFPPGLTFPETSALISSSSASIAGSFDSMCK